MALVVADRVKESTSTTGTGALTLGGASAGYRTFASVCSDGDTVAYCVDGGADWETGIGTYNSSGGTLSRTSVIASSNAGAAVNFGSGTKYVFCAFLARQAAWSLESPLEPPALPNAVDDEFGGPLYPAETALDTAGTRFSGATAWQWRNQGTSTATLTNGRLVLVPQENSQLRGIEQAIPSGSWKIRAKVSARIDLPAGGGVILAMYGVNNANGKLIVGGLASISGVFGIYSSAWNSVSSWSADRHAPGAGDVVQSASAWIEAEYDGTTLTFRASATGEEGSFSQFASETVASFLGGLTHLGLAGYADGTPKPAALLCDCWRRVA
jgi:hypothetical protein